MSKLEIKAYQIGIMVDKTVVVKSQELANELIKDPDSVLKQFEESGFRISKDQISIDSFGTIVIRDAALSDDIMEKLKSSVAAAGDSNYGVCVN